MNIDKLVEIAEWLEAGATYVKGVSRFDMTHFIERDHCGTSCCIAGAAIQFDRKFPYADGEVTGAHETARRILGLTFAQALALFYGEGSDCVLDPDEGDINPLSRITPAWAARCIRKLIETGKVDWAGTYVPLSLQP